MEVTVTRTISNERISDVIVNGIETGTSYWCNAVRAEDEKGNPIKWQQMCSNDNLIGRGKIIFTVDDYENPKEFTLDLTGNHHVQQALQLMTSPEIPSRHLENIINGDDDAETGDVFIQICLFAEIIYE